MWGFGFLQLSRQLRYTKKNLKDRYIKPQLEQSYSWIMVTVSIVPLHPSIHSGQLVPPPSLLPSTSVFIFCLPTPT